MDMKTWLGETEHAMRAAIELIWAEHAAVAEATVALAKLEAATERGYRQSEAFTDTFDDEGLATALHWDTYFGVDKQRYHAAEALDVLMGSQEARTSSRAVLAGTALQIAKQGLSAVHGKPDASPDGRNVVCIVLKELIWQGRNQAMHWEEGKPHKAVEACFEKLKDVNPAFADYAVRNLAFEVIELLGWNDYGAFEADMLSLA